MLFAKKPLLILGGVLLAAILVTAIVLMVVFIPRGNELYALNIIHYNDFHARFEETAPDASACDPTSAPCVGGFPRMYTATRQMLAASPDSLLFNAGDSFQGTLWYNLMGWNVTQYAMNMLPHDAHVLGNHEFDHGIDGVVPYLDALDSIMLAANIDDSLEPSIQGKYQKTAIFERNGRRIGVIGVIISTTNYLAASGNLIFFDETETVRAEAEILHQQGVDIILVLSHSGLDTDRQIARNGGPHIDLIIGGHSHTLLYNGVSPSGDNPADAYPVVEEQNDGHKVLIVQASAFARYIGEIKLYIDSDGIVQDWEGSPHYLDNSVEQDPTILELLEPFRLAVNEQAMQVIGNTTVPLTSSCGWGECNLGSLICDSFVDRVRPKAAPGNNNFAHVCIGNNGGFRANINVGDITYGDLMMAQPFENMVESYDLPGSALRAAFEHSLSDTGNGNQFTGIYMLQVSGVRAIYDVTQPTGSRIVEVNIRCIECEDEVYDPLDDTKTYKVVAQNFLSAGGDQFTMLPEHRTNVVVEGLDYRIIWDYIAKMSPISQLTDGRITLITS